MIQINIFISHSWKYSEHYNTLSEWIFNQKWTKNDGTSIIFNDLSVPKDNPIHYASNDHQLRDAIYQKVLLSNIVVIPSGMYASHSKWIGKEIEGAKSYSKPILCVNPWGQQKNSSVVEENADSSCGWNKKSVVDAIWSLYQAKLASSSSQRFFFHG